MSAEDLATTQPPPQLNRPGSWTPGLHKLAGVGPKTGEVVVRLLGQEPAYERINKFGDQVLTEMADALTKSWADEKAAEFLGQFQ